MKFESLDTFLLIVVEFKLNSRRRSVYTHVLIYCSILNEILVYKVVYECVAFPGQHTHKLPFTKVVYPFWLVDWDFRIENISMDQSECIYYLCKGSRDWFKKMRLGFSNIVTILLVIMLISIHRLKDQTLRIPKW